MKSGFSKCHGFLRQPAQPDRIGIGDGRTQRGSDYAGTGKASNTLRLKGIAGVNFPILQTGFKPEDALSGCPMGKGFGCDIPPRLFLQAIVTDSACRVQRLLYIPAFEQLPGSVGIVGPDAGQTIGLQFQFYRQRIGLSPV